MSQLKADIRDHAKSYQLFLLGFAGMSIGAGINSPLMMMVTSSIFGAALAWREHENRLGEIEQRMDTYQREIAQAHQQVDEIVSRIKTPQSRETMTWKEFKQVENDLRAEGWLRYTYPIDAEVSERETCLECGSKIAYHTGFKAHPRGYRCFAVCSECCSVYEF